MQLRITSPKIEFNVKNYKHEASVAGNKTKRARV